MLRSLVNCPRIVVFRSQRFLSHENPDKNKKSKTKSDILKEKTPKGKLEEDVPYVDPHLPRHPGGVNPVTGEYGGPAGVEPTRYGDWERKGRVSDF